ncbi:MAG: hypothetical protein GY757_01015 [bacterium]|nr:hypothetical protein [bacterium]
MPEEINEISDSETENRQSTAEPIIEPPQEQPFTGNTNPPERQPEGDKNSLTSTIETVGRDANIAQNMELDQRDQRDQSTKNYFLGEGEVIQIKQFSIKNAIPLKKEDTHEETFVFPGNTSRDLATQLETKRLLLLTGDPGTGKNATAKYLAAQMMNKNPEQLRIKMVTPLARNTVIDLMELTRSEAFNGSIILFKDAFARKNQYITDFFMSLTPEQSAFATQRLTQGNAYMIFTADTGTFDAPELEKTGLPHHISPVSPEQLEKGFQLKLDFFCSQEPKRANVTRIFTKKKRAQIIDTLGTMSKITFFIENYLDKILSEEIEIGAAVEEARDYGKKIKKWLLNELGGEQGDFEAWTFAICLALFNNSTYVDFNRLHEGITRLLLKTFRPPGFNEDFFFSQSENKLLEKCHAHITKDMISGDHVVEFRDPSYRETYLSLLLENNRKVMFTLLPYLEEYVLSQHDHDQRRRAAYSIARIGQLGPGSVTLPLIKKWATMKKGVHRTNVGYLFEGIIAGQDDAYRKYCLRYLKEMALSSDFDEQWTAIAAYKQIGIRDLAFAMTELRKIQETVNRRKKNDESLLETIYENTNLLSEIAVVKNLDKIYKKTDTLLSTIRYSIIALAILTDPIDVLAQLNKWIHKGNNNTKITVVLFTLGLNGLLRELENREVVYLSGEDGDNPEEYRSNILLFTLASGGSAVNTLARFLRNLYTKCFTQYPLEVENALKSVLFNHLRKWTIETLDNPRINKAVKKLLIKLYKLGDRTFADTMWNTINQWSVPAKKEKQLNAFLDELEREI